MIWVTTASAVSLDRYNLADPEEVVTAYFQCLVEGDVVSLTSLISGNLLERKKQMLSNVDHYAAFLRNYYNDSQLLSIKMSRVENNKIQGILEVLKQGEVISFKLILSKIDGWWVITDDITP
jgi:hypothetical protein